MTKKLTKIIRPLTFAFVLIYLANIVPTSVIAEQKTTRQTVAWYAEFTLTIKGKGKQEGEFDGDPDIEWKIDREYYSNFTMTGPHPWKEYGKPVTLYKTKLSRAIPLTVNVKIADKLKITKKERFQHDSTETTADVTLWEQDAPETGDSYGLSLMIDGSAFLVSGVPLPTTIKKKNLKISKQTEIERSEYGFGDKPRRESLSYPDKFAYVTDLSVPQIEVGSAIELTGVGGTPILITRTELLPTTYPSLITYDSKSVQPSKPMIEGIPDSKTNVQIRLVCRFSRKPFY